MRLADLFFLIFFISFKLFFFPRAFSSLDDLKDDTKEEKSSYSCAYGRRALARQCYMSMKQYTFNQNNINVSKCRIHTFRIYMCVSYENVSLICARGHIYTNEIIRPLITTTNRTLNAIVTKTPFIHIYIYIDIYSTHGTAYGCVLLYFPTSSFLFTSIFYFRSRLCIIPSRFRWESVLKCLL